jgi:2-methylcitrate dehydratase PrpD
MPKEGGKMESISTEFARFARKLRFEDLGPEVVAHAKQLILDLVGVALAGYSMDFPRMTVDYISELGGRSEATILRQRKKAPVLLAAFANGVCSHALDMDDGHRYGAVHPASAIIPAAIAAAEWQKRDGKDLITAVVAGYEVLLRISRAINPSHLLRGFHTTGTVGPFGAAIAAARLMDLGHEETVSALGLAGLQGAGLLEILHDGAMVKPIHPGKAAESGVLSAILAQKGARGPVSIFEGQKGFLVAMADKADPGSLLEGLGKRFECLGGYFKLHAACRHIHAIVDAALEICKKNALSAKEIEQIKIGTYPVAIQFCGNIVHPETVSAAKFSIPCSVAMAITFGDLFNDKYVEKNIENEEIKALASRIKASSQEEWARAYPDQRGATVRIKTCSGQSYSQSVGLAKGEPENPATLEDLKEKFRTNAAQVLSPKRTENLMESIMDLDHSRVSDMTRYF